MGFDFIVCCSNYDAIKLAAARMEHESRPKTRNACSTVMTNARVHDATGPGVQERVCQRLRWTVALRDRLRLKTLLTFGVIEKVELP